MTDDGMPQKTATLEVKQSFGVKNDARRKQY